MPNFQARKEGRIHWVLFIEKKNQLQIDQSKWKKTAEHSESMLYILNESPLSLNFPSFNVASLAPAQLDWDHFVKSRATFPTLRRDASPAMIEIAGAVNSFVRISHYSLHGRLTGSKGVNCV